MNRKQLLDTIGRSLNKSDVLDPRTQARLLDYLNRRHRQIMSAPGMQGLRRRQLEGVMTTPGVARIAFLGGEKIHHVRDLTNDRELSQRSLNTYRQFNPDPTQTQGTPDGYIQYGFEPVQFQPADLGFPSTQLFAASSSAADVAPLTLTVETVLGSGVATMTGLTPVALGLHGWIDKFYLSAQPAGVITLHAESATGPRLSELRRPSHRWLACYYDPTPSAALEYAFDAEFDVSDLAADTDEPDLPSDFHDLLEMGAIMDELGHLDDDRVVLLQQRYDRRFGELKLRLARMGTDSGPRGRSSRYGSWAPAGRW